MNYERVKTYINIFSHWKRKANIELVTIHGQHDQSYHLKSDNTPIAVLDEANVINLLPQSGWCCSMQDVDFYGCSYGEEIPKPNSPGRFSILVIHKMISDKDYWNGHVQYASVQWMLNQCKDYNLIISGDNHKSFHSFGIEKTALVNCGSLMRSTIAQSDHIPNVWVFDTSPNTSAREFYIPVQPFYEVFDMKEIKEVKLRREESEVFVTRLEQGIDATELDFPKNLRVAMQSQEPGVNALIEEAM
jgi:hypothetical protein